MTPISSSLSIAPVLCGLGAHFVCHKYPPATLPAFTAVLIFPPLALLCIVNSQLSVLTFLQSWGLYLVTLGASIALYRLSPFHPLAQYPGPVLARVSRLWATGVVLGGRQHIVSHELFERYGEVVRTGPNHLIIRNADAIPVMHGAKNPWLRGGRYTVGVPYTSRELVALVDPAEHRERRKLWEPAFSIKSVKSYTPSLRTRLEQLTTQLDSRLGTSLDIAEWLGWLSLDYMSDFCYGGFFDFTARGADHLNVHQFGVEGLKVTEALGTIPWVRPIICALPNPAALDKWMAMSTGIVKNRKSGGSNIRDLSYYLMNEGGEAPHPGMTTETLTREGMLALFAGSDTTATTLSNIIFYLATNMNVTNRLRAELDGAAGEDAAYDVDVDEDRLVDLKYLQGVINETLRLQPASPNGAQRIPPPGSGPVVVAGHVVPDGTTMQIPTWSLHRDPRYFSPDPTVFWPERWLPDEGPKTADARGQAFRLDTNAFNTFSYGPANCIGRALALNEIRVVVSALVRRYDIQLAPGFQQSDWTDNLTDRFALIRDKLLVVLSKRA